MGSLSIFGPLCIDMYLPALPTIGRELHASAWQVQLTLTGCMVGIAAGQLFIGPLSDRLGRRRPLLVGLITFSVSSLICAAAPNVFLLAGFRFIQGLGGAAGVVISRSIVRDLHSGVDLVRFFSTLMLATGLGPVLAPQIGSGVLSVMSWRGVFIVLAGLGTVLLASTFWRLPETLAPDKRGSGGVRHSISTMSTLLSDKHFVGCLLASSLGMGGLFAYIAGSSFVFQNVYSVSRTDFGLLFAFNAIGLVLGAQINGRVVSRYGSGRLLKLGLATMTGGGFIILALVIGQSDALWAVMASMFATLFGAGFVTPNSMAMALQRHPDAAGSAAALIGASQFLLGAGVAPLAGIGGSADAVPMAALLSAMPGIALLVILALGSSRARTGLPHEG